MSRQARGPEGEGSRMDLKAQVVHLRPGARWASEGLEAVEDQVSSEDRAVHLRVFSGTAVRHRSRGIMGNAFPSGGQDLIRGREAEAFSIFFTS